MKRLIIAVILIYSSLSVYGQGTVVDTSFFSTSLNADRSLHIYLPEGYDPNGAIDYPVVYFLHGATVNHTAYQFLNGILDILISNQTIEPVIMVRPDGSVSPYAGSLYANSELYGQFEDYIVFDLVNFIDNNFRTIANRNKRTIMGHSMGGIGSVKLALKHPDVYRGLASHSGPLDYNLWPVWIPNVLAENGGGPTYNFQPSAGTFTYFYFTIAGAYSSNLNNPPYFVDFLLDSLGNIVDSTFAKWLLHSPPHLAANVPQGTELAVYFDCGIQDELLLYEFNTAFADSLDQLGWDYEFQSFTGGHSNQLTNRLPISLAFLDSVMNIPVGIIDEQPNLAESIVLYQNYPNPFNPVTTIEFTLPTNAEVTLVIYNVTGQEVERLIERRSMAPGDHSVEWAPRALPSGVYFYRLTAGGPSAGSPQGQAGQGFTQSRKMVLMK